jgi:hypothetical protein
LLEFSILVFIGKSWNVGVFLIRNNKVLQIRCFQYILIWFDSIDFDSYHGHLCYCQIHGTVSKSQKWQDLFLGQWSNYDYGVVVIFLF